MAFRQREATALLVKLASPLRVAIRHDRVAQVALNGNEDRAAGTDRDGHLTTTSMRHVHEHVESHERDALAAGGSCAVTGRLGVGRGEMVYRRWSTGPLSADAGAGNSVVLSGCDVGCADDEVVQGSGDEKSTGLRPPG